MLDAEHPKLTTQYKIVNSKSGPFPIAKQLAHPAKLANYNLIIMQNKPNSRIAKMNLTFFPTKDYKNETAFGPKQNKPNQTQFKNQTNAAAFDKSAKRRTISALVTQSAKQVVV